MSDREERGEGKKVRLDESPEVIRENVVEIAEVWRKEMEDSLEKEKSEEGFTFDYLLEEGAWDHVHGGDLPLDLVRAARIEEVKLLTVKSPNQVPSVILPFLLAVPMKANCTGSLAPVTSVAVNTQSRVMESPETV